MINSINTIVCAIFLLNGFCCICQGKRTQLSPSANLVPTDSFIVVSVDTQKLLDKSNILSSGTWKPIWDQWRARYPEIQELLDHPKDSGIDLESPLQFFARLQGNPYPTPVWGVLASVKNGKKADSLLLHFAEKLKLKEKGGKSLRLGGDILPFEIGRNGKWTYALGLIPNPKNPLSPSFELQIDQVVQDIFSKHKKVPHTLSLEKHFAQTADASIYWEGVGISRLLEDFFFQDTFKSLLPAFDFLTHRPFGIHLHSRQGKIDASFFDYSDVIVEEKPTFDSEYSQQSLKILDRVPGDAPIIANIDFPQHVFKSSVSSIVHSSLQFLSNGKFDTSTPLPGFEAPLSELLDAFSGKFVIAGGDLKLKPIPAQSIHGSLLERFKTSFLLGCHINDSFSAKQLLASIRSSTALVSVIKANRLKIIESADMLWICTDDYQKEIEANQPIYQLSYERRRRLKPSPFSLDINISAFTQSAREEDDLHFGENKTLRVFDHFTSLTLKKKPNEIACEIDLHNPTKQGLQVIVDLWGQEIIEARNDTLYRAIAQNDLNALAQSIDQGALINANDRLGHTPLHYCAFKGNARFVDYLLRNGGNPNVKGRHYSTPLHSAAWGRNIDVFELLLEDGAEVDARTDEGETPGMTAALRGEKEMLEILFALSADPHAKDDHGSNMLDLAAAGGHEDIVHLLSQMKVAKNHPLHVAAGLGKLELMKDMLKNGHNVNETDSFGATPLLIAVVSNKMEIVQFLLSQKADPKITAKDGYTLMHGAAFSGSKDMVKLALSYDLDVNPRYGKDGITPVDVAEDEKKALPYLRSLGGKASWELAPVPH
ncbi:MAG: DUF4836 family protein [Opitutales bacterium]|nr:DUF4836 family protein [Opitutales bacterium]